MDEEKRTINDVKTNFIEEVAFCHDCDWKEKETPELIILRAKEHTMKTGHTTEFVCSGNFYIIKEEEQTYTKSEDGK